MKIAIFDYLVTQTNPAGSCHFRMLKALSDEHDFTVFSLEFENPNPKRIAWVHVPAPRRPLALMFLTYQFMAPLCYWLHRLRHRARFDLHQMNGPAALMPAGICYAHFCHREFLQRHWKHGRPRGLRRLFRWLDHKLQSLFELLLFRRFKLFVCPSRGLARSLNSLYPFTAEKIRVLPNAVRNEEMGSPTNFDRTGFRRTLGIATDDVLMVFVALGHYERKGLPLILEAMTHFPGPSLKLVVVGGLSDLVADYQARGGDMGLRERVAFEGMKKDVRPYLWASDALIHPSSYETFCLAVLEAAAAGLPLLVTLVTGVEEFLEDGKNGILLEGTAEGVARGIRRFLDLSPEARRRIGERAQQDTRIYCERNFAASWQAFYGGLHVA